MSNKPFVQSGQTAGPSDEAEYAAVYAEVTATERGRWFLAEFATRNRGADTDLVMAAIARIEAAIRAGAAPQLSATISRDLAASAAAIAPVRESDDDAASAQRWSPVRIADTQAQQQDSEAQKDRDYSDAVAAIAASLTAGFGELAERPTQNLPVDVPQEPETDSINSSTEGAAENKLAEAATAEPRVPQDNAPRWHIESPDFVFDKSGDEDKNGGAEPADETALSHSQLLGAALLSEDADEDAEAFEESPPRAVIEADAEPAAEPAPADVIGPPAAEAPIPSFAPPPEIAPLAEISRPQLRIANEPAPVNQQPRRYDSLTETDALSEDEVIALFG